VPPLARKPRQALEPPSATPARVWTLLAAFWLWFLLPVAIHFQRKARREVEESHGRYEWPRTIWNRPLLLWFVVFIAGMALIFAMAATGMYGP
jgi:hypothetical protein